MESFLDNDKPGKLFIMVNIPVEVLVYIFSFLPTTREKVKMRYVSKRLKLVSETPSLWTEFVWPFYDCREELSVMNVLKACGMHIKRLLFPNHVSPPLLIQMLSHCSKVTQLCLPPSSMFDSEELVIALEHMAKLEKLEVQLSDDIEPLLEISGLKELTVHVPEEYHSSCAEWVVDWMRNGCVPVNLNLFTARFDEESETATEASFFQSILRKSYSPLPGYTSYFRLFYKLKPPLDLFPSLPDFQLEIGQTVTVPSVKPDNFGILGLGKMMLMERTCNGKLFCKAEHPGCNMYNVSIPMNSTITSLDCITEFNFASSGLVNSGHLEQLANVCRNLQRLNLENNSDCLMRLRGIYMISKRCLGLQGLNLKKISSVESHIGLWEILSSMKLTHLAMDVCIFHGPLQFHFLSRHRTDDALLIPLFQRFSSLQALDFFNPSFYRSETCKSCEDHAGTDTKWSLLSHFPSLKYCRISSMHSNVLQDVINGCKEVTVLSCNSLPQTVSSVTPTNLQQLYIFFAMTTDIPEIFMETVSAHGGLIHVVLFASSVTVDGIVSLIKNSPKLITLNIYAELISNQGTASPEDRLKKRLQKFSNRKLFNGGCSRFIVSPSTDHSLCEVLTETDLSLLWQFYCSP